MSKETPIGKWKGKPVEFSVMIVEITNILGGAMPRMKPYIGTKRQAVKVSVGNHRPFYLDNEDGTGLYKIFNGGGSEHEHRSLGEPKELKEVPEKDWNRKILKGKGRDIEKFCDDYWKKKNPEKFVMFEKRRKMQAEAAKHQQPLP